MQADNAATLHFVGGPLDGQMLTWPDGAPPTFRVPTQPVINFTASDDEPLIPGCEVYDRRSGVVASEAVYDWRSHA